MDWNDIIIIITGLLVSLGGAGTIILGFSKFIGDFFAKRYEEKIKANFQKDINEYQSQLDILKQTTLRYSDKQFELYSILWSSLHDLKVLADDLWVQANSRNLESFARQLRKTKIEIERASLFIEDTHYERLINTLKQFGNYQIGKRLLIDYRHSGFDNFEITQMIEGNGNLKREYEQLITEVKMDLRKQIKGYDSVSKHL